MYILQNKEFTIAIQHCVNSCSFSIFIVFNKSYFGNEKNDPILKGRSSYSTDEELKVYKAVFSTCNIKNKKWSQRDFARVFLR